MLALREVAATFGNYLPNRAGISERFTTRVLQIVTFCLMVKSGSGQLSSMSSDVHCMSIRGTDDLDDLCHFVAFISGRYSNLSKDLPQEPHSLKWLKLIKFDVSRCPMFIHPRCWMF